MVVVYVGGGEEPEERFPLRLSIVLLLLVRYRVPLSMKPVPLSQYISLPLLLVLVAVMMMIMWLVLHLDRPSSIGCPWGVEAKIRRGLRGNKGKSFGRQTANC
jgi:hypothetical protein